MLYYPYSKLQNNQKKYSYKGGIVFMEKRYTIREHILDVYQKQARQLPLDTSSIEKYEQWKEKVQNTLKEISGINQMERCDLTPKGLDEEIFKDHIRKKVIIQTEPKVWMPLYILIPTDLKNGEKRPVIIAPHGHGCGGKAGIAGNTKNTQIQKGIENYQCDYGLRLVREGYIVFCPDARGSGERMEDVSVNSNVDNILTSACNDLNFAAISLGQSLLGMMTWDLIRLVDYVETLESCDLSKIACVGFSGGGLQTLWLSALDERIKAAYISGYFYTIQSALLHTHRCGCNFVPNLWKYVDLGDIAALIAPRPLFIESGKSDKLNGTMGIESAANQVKITKKAYTLFGKENHIQHLIFEGTHVFHGEALSSFLYHCFH